jgi:hypothetical protein
VGLLKHVLPTICLLVVVIFVATIALIRPETSAFIVDFSLVRLVRNQVAGFGAMPDDLYN